MPDDNAAEPLATIARLRRELAEARAERDEALAQQTATAEVLGVINSSPGDLAPVFDAILEKARKLCGFAHGTLNTYDGEYFRTVAFHAIPEAFADVLRQPRRTGPNFERLLRGEGFVQVADLRDRKFSSDDPVHRAAVEIGGVRTLLMVPLRKDGVLLGYFTANRQEVRPFTDKQIALLQNFAAQAVIAMENARLLGELRQRTADLGESLEYQTATSDVLKVISRSAFDLQPVLDTLCETAVGLCGVQWGNIWRLEDGAYRWASGYGVEGPYLQIQQNAVIPPGRDTLVGRVAVTGETVHILDGLADPGYAAKDDLRIVGCRTMLGVPLLREGAVIGVICMGKTKLEAVTDKQIELVRTFADQAVIAMENARLITETREALEQQTATAEVLGVINTSPGNLTPVFDAMLEKAMRLCGAAFGIMHVTEGEQFRGVATLGVPVTYDEFMRQNPIPLAAAGIVARLRGGEPFIHNIDLQDHELYRRGDPQRRALVDLAGARSSLAVALRQDQHLLGTIHIYRQQVRPFTDKQIALLQNFAAQAVIAMENARLITETREALEQQTATAEVLGVINSSPGDLAPVFDAILEKAHAICGAPQGAMYICEGEYSRAVAVRGLEPIAERLRAGRPIAGGMVGGRLLAGERFVHITDIAELDHFSVAGGSRTVLGVPLRKGDALLGFISAARPEVRPFSDREIAVLENFAAQAVIAMENARLLGELRQRNDEIAGWNRELEDRVAAQLGELERVGKLKRFLAPQLAELIVARGDEAVLETHRRDIVVVFCDLRDFTAFAETAEPEEVLDLLREYHGALGPVVSASEGTLDHFSGDGIMVFFNDPVPVADASERAVRMAIEMRAAMAGLQEAWRRQGRRIGFGAGIARGYATLGQIGFAERIDYTAIGTVCNLAARLCAEAKDGQILVSQRVAAAVEAAMPLEEMGEVALKGLSQPVAVYNLPA